MTGTRMTKWLSKLALVFSFLVGSSQVLAEVAWQTSEGGPGKLGNKATLVIPEGYLFAPKEQMPELNRLTGNLDSPNDLGALMPAREEPWIAFFTFDAIGYVKDADKEELDADELLKSFKDSDGPSNEERAKQGMEKLFTVGWHTPPFYDATTNNLTWALNLRTEQGAMVINHNIRVLARKGVLEIILVAAPERIAQAISEFTPLLANVNFNDGESYAEFREGDKIAEYGLAGLILGGGLALAAKSGLLTALLKNAKVLVLAAVGGLTALGSAVKRFFGGGGGQKNA